MELIKVKKIEIIITATFVRKTLDILTELNVSGYTEIDVVKGKGTRSGEVFDKGNIPVYKNAFIVIVCSPDKASQVIEKLDDMIQKNGGLLLISDVETTSKDLR